MMLALCYIESGLSPFCYAPFGRFDSPSNASHLNRVRTRGKGRCLLASKRPAEVHFRKEMYLPHNAKHCQGEIFCFKWSSQASLSRRGARSPVAWRSSFCSQKASPQGALSLCFVCLFLFSVCRGRHPLQIEWSLQASLSRRGETLTKAQAQRISSRKCISFKIAQRFQGALFPCFVCLFLFSVCRGRHPLQLKWSSQASLKRGRNAHRWRGKALFARKKYLHNARLIIFSLSSSFFFLLLPP